jgi:hypothetical protein
MFQDFIRAQIPQMENTYLNTSRYELLKATIFIEKETYVVCFKMHHVF